MESLKTIQDFLIKYSGKKYRKPASNEDDEMISISRNGKDAREDFTVLGKIVLNRLPNFTMGRCSKWLSMNQVIPNYFWIEFKEKGFETCPSSISLAIKKVKYEIYLYVAVEIKDQNANEENFKNHNRILNLPLNNDKLYYSSDGEDFFNLGTDASYVGDLINKGIIKKVRIQQNIEISNNDGDIINNIIDAIKILQPYYNCIIKNFSN